MKHKKLTVGACIIAVVVATCYIAWQTAGDYLTNSFERLRNFSHKNQSLVGHTPRLSSDLLTNIRLTLAQLEVDTADVSSQLFVEERCRELHARVPQGLPAEHVVWLLTQAATRTPYHVTDCYMLPSEDAYQIAYASPKKNCERIRLVFRWAERYFSETGRLAFLVEDFGFEANTTTMKFLSFDEPLTVSLRPVAERSLWTAKIADHYRKEIVVLLAMESKFTSTAASPVGPIMVHHSEEQILRTIADASDRIPNYAGFCNLGGSRLLEDTRATRIMLTEIRNRHGYFVDTKAAQAPVVPDIAAAAGVPYRQVDGTIDGTCDRERIDQLLRAFVRRAQKTGSALIRAPLNTDFIDALEAGKSYFRHNGIKLVFVSDILVHPE